MFHLMLRRSMAIACLVGALGLAGCATKTPEEQKQAEQDGLASDYNVKLGMAYLRTGQLDRARLKLTKAVEYNPKSPEANSAMGYFKEKMGEPGAARAYYVKAVRLAPHKGTVLNNYGTFLCRHGEYRLSIDQFEKAVADQNYRYVGGALENAGICALKIPDRALAKNYFGKALLNDPNLGRSLLEMAGFDYAEGNYAGADRYLQKFRAHHPVNAKSVWLALQVARKLNDQDAIATQAQLLKTKFSKSKQYLQYLKDQT